MDMLLKFGIGASTSTFGFPRFAMPRYEMGVFKTGVFKMGDFKTGKFKTVFAENLGQSRYFLRLQTFRMNSMTTMTPNHNGSRKVSNKTVTSLASSFNENQANYSMKKNSLLETPLLVSGEPSSPSRNFV